MIKSSQIEILLSMLLILFTIISTPYANAQPTEPHAANAIWVEPSTLSFNTATTSVGANFTITIWENITTDDMFTWQVKIYYDKTQLSFVSGSNAYGDWASYANPGPNGVIDGTSPVPFVTGEDAGGPYLLWGLSLLGDDFIPAGTVASLMSVSFKIIAAPSPGQVLTSKLHINHADTFMLNPDLAEITVTKYDSNYIYASMIDITPPIIGRPTQIPPAESVQPYQNVTVYVNVTDTESGVKNVTLIYTNNTIEYKVLMAFNKTSSLWEGTIPGQPANTLVRYKIEAYDNAGNFAVNDNAGAYFTYTVIPEFTWITLFALLALITSIFIITRKSLKAYRKSLFIFQ
jgi:hypothetical protein